MIEAGLSALLLGNSAVAAIAGAKVFFGDAPPDPTQYPCVAISMVGGSSDPTFSSNGMIRQRVELNAFANAPDSGGNSPRTVAGNLRAAVIAALSGWQQLLSDGTCVSNAVLLNPGTDFGPGEDRIFRCMCEFYVLFTLPTS